MEKSNRKLSQKELKQLVFEIVEKCKQIAANHVRNWQPMNPDWAVEKGCAYLRLSTDQQVAVEKGSLEQQVNIAISEAMIRSSTDRINYKIEKFYIEPGITGTTDKRPQFELMQLDIKAHKHRFVVIKEVARIARETSIWKSFFKLCIDQSCEIFIRGFPFNPNDPTQILQLDILSAFAAYESHQNSKRVRESNFSAMVSSGKFNSTHPVLGLDQLVVNGVPQVGFYTPNYEELKTVEWIFRTFVKYESVVKTLAECEKLKVTNKNGSTFKKSSLVTLLTNKKLIGKNEVNLENKDKNQDKLMPYERYAEVELPHGCVVNAALWKDVQDTLELIGGHRRKNYCTRRVYPLSGLIEYIDGSPFHGTGATNGSGERTNYYHNHKHGFRIPVEVLEGEARRNVKCIMEDSKRFRNSVANFISNSDTTVELLKGEIQALKHKIVLLEKEKGLLNKRLDFILQDADPSEAASFRTRYKSDMKRINSEIDSLNQGIAEIDRDKKEFEENTLTAKNIASRIVEVQKVSHDAKPDALKGFYAKLFDRIVVGEVRPDGTRHIKFELKNELSKRAELQPLTMRTDLLLRENWLLRTDSNRRQGG